MMITLSFLTDADRLIAAQLVAQLVREGVQFSATTSRDGVEFIIRCTGGY